MKTLLYALLLLPILLISCGPSAEDLEELEQERLLQIEQEQEAIRIEDARLHNLKLLVDQADSLIIARQFKLAVSAIDSALQFANNEGASLNLKKADCFFELRLYEDAIEAYTIPIESKIDLANASFGRAQCYDKIGERQLAVEDLRLAMNLGNEEANVFHEKINPELKRVAYYETLCCDGTTSNAKGRGACSHHGGVCNWNNPVYETYRKYQ